MFAIDSGDPTPIYAQLERSIRVAIATGRLAVGARLPTVRQLAVELRVNANTVAKVYTEAERAGILETRRGVGTFVQEVAEPVSPREERVTRLLALADRFLTDGESLGFGADETVELLRQHLDEIRKDGRSR